MCASVCALVLWSELIVVNYTHPSLSLSPSALSCWLASGTKCLRPRLKWFPRFTPHFPHYRGQLHLLLLHFDGRLSEFEHIIKLDCTYRHGQALLLCSCPSSLALGISLYRDVKRNACQTTFSALFRFLFKICSSTTSCARSRTRGETGAPRGGGERGGERERTPVQVAWRCPWQLTHFDPLAPGAWQLQLFGIGPTFTYLIKRLHSALPLAPITSPASALHPVRCK